MSIQNLVKFFPFILKIFNKKHILTSMKGCNSVANLQKMTLYNLNIDFVKDNVCIKGCNYVANLRKTEIYNTNVDLVNDNVYTNFDSFCQFVLKILTNKSCRMTA